MSGHDGFGTARTVAAASNAEIAIGITRRNNGELGRTTCSPDSTVADGLSFIDFADLSDAHLQIDHRMHRRVGFRRRIDAVKCGTGPHQVEMKL